MELLCGAGAVAGGEDKPAMISAFICSTSRIVLPIRRIAMPLHLLHAHTPTDCVLNTSRCMLMCLSRVCRPFDMGHVCVCRIDLSITGWAVLQLDANDAVCAKLVSDCAAAVLSHSEPLFEDT